MKLKIFLVLITLFLINFAVAQSFCVDFDPPSPPSNLTVTSSGQNIILTWGASTDIPDCSGVDYYNIARDGIIIGEQITILTYTDLEVAYGTYFYSVYAVDKVSHNSGLAIKNDVVLSAPVVDNGGEDSSGGGGSTRVGGGSGSTSYVCYENWQCSDWSACANEKQTRTCEDLEKCGTTITKPTEFQACYPEVIETFDASPNIFSRITGAVIGTLGTGGTIAISVFVLGILGSLIVITKVRKKR